MTVRRKYRSFIAIPLLAIVMVSPLFAQGPEGQKELNKKLNSELAYLVSLAGSKTAEPIDVESFKCLLQLFQDNTISLDFCPKPIGKTTPATSAFSLNCPLNKLLRYCYSSELHSFMMMPSAVRFSNWLEIDGVENAAVPELSERIKTITEPFSYSGVGHLDLTPDINTGIYYSYDEDRCVILLPGDRKIFISISAQREKSNLGLNGAVVTDDHNWIYLFSGEQGASKRGIGWAKTYINSSYCITMYCEEENNTTRMVTFKWISAGWSGINMVKKKHIIKGVVRFTNTLTHILESPNLPSYKTLLVEQNRVEALTEDELREQVKPYLAVVAEMDSALVRRKPFSKQLASGKHLKIMTRYDLEKVVLTEYLKGALGLPRVVQKVTTTPAPIVRLREKGTARKS